MNITIRKAHDDWSPLVNMEFAQTQVRGGGPVVSISCGCDGLSLADARTLHGILGNAIALAERAVQATAPNGTNLERPNER